MTQYKTISTLKELAKNKLDGKYGSAMLVSPVLQGLLTFSALFPITLIFIVIYTIFLELTGGEMSIAFIFTTVMVFLYPCTILLGVFNTGISLFYLNIACGKKCSVNDLFFGFRWQFKKSLALSAISVTCSAVFMIPYTFFAYKTMVSSDIIWSVLGLVSYLLGFAAGYPIRLALSQCYYLLLDFPQYSTKQLIQHSIKLMNGQKRRMVYIDLHFVPLGLLCSLTSSIGYLWITPYRNMVNALFFLDIMNPHRIYDQE